MCPLALAENEKIKNPVKKQGKNKINKILFLFFTRFYF